MIDHVVVEATRPLRVPGLSEVLDVRRETARDAGDKVPPEQAVDRGLAVSQWRVRESKIAGGSCMAGDRPALGAAVRVRHDAVEHGAALEDQRQEVAVALPYREPAGEQVGDRDPLQRAL